MTWAIKDYQDVFWLKEAARAKEVTWGKFPAARNSTSYRRLMRTSRGNTAYCVFVAIWRLVTRGKVEDGSLVIKGRTITVDDIYDECGIDKQKIADSIEVLKSPEIGWLVTAEFAAQNNLVEPVPKTEVDRSDSGFKTGEKRALPVNHPFASSSGSSSPSYSSSFSSPGFRARAIAEGPRTDAWEQAEKAIAGILGRDLSTHELARVGPWAEKHAEMVTEIHGQRIDGAELLRRALEAAGSTGVNGTVSQVVAWCESVLDRCRRQQCWPNETPKLKPTKFKTVGGTSKATLERIAAEEA